MNPTRLSFRALALGDENYIFPEVDADLTKYWIGWEPAQGLEEERRRIEVKLRLNEIPPNFEFMVFDQSHQFVGCCGVSPSEAPDEFEINIWVAHGQQRKGYGTEMLTAVLQWTREHSDLSYLIYSITEGNAGSTKIIEQNGGQFYREVMYEKRGVMMKVRDYKITL